MRPRLCRRQWRVDIRHNAGADTAVEMNSLQKSNSGLRFSICMVYEECGQALTGCGVDCL